MYYLKRIVTVGVLLLVGIPTIAGAQELVNDYQATLRARVVESRKKEIPWTGTFVDEQRIRAEILEGDKEGQIITIENDYIQLQRGQRFYVNHLVDIDGTERYVVLNVDRKGGIAIVVGLFVIAVLALGRWQGLRSLLALAGSFLAIFYVLIPGLLAGWNPFVASFIVAAGVLFFAIFFTHGFNRESAVAYGGTMIAVALTALLATIAVSLAQLTGMVGEEVTYLNFSTKGSLDMTGILLGAIIIGVLGVLDDIAVTQAAVVTELYHADPAIKKSEVYRRALRVGREHVGALVNTLVLAYVGTSLPLLMYMSLAEGSFGMLVNLEVFATEIVRTTVGSIGLIMTVPIVTFLAVVFLKNYKPKHHHGHSHAHAHGHTH